MTRVATREGDKLVVEATNFNDRIRGTPYVLGLREDDFGLYGILAGARADEWTAAAEAARLSLK